MPAIHIRNLQFWSASRNDAAWFCNWWQNISTEQFRTRGWRRWRKCSAMGNRLVRWLHRECRQDDGWKMRQIDSCRTHVTPPGISKYQCYSCSRSGYLYRPRLLPEVQTWLPFLTEPKTRRRTFRWEVPIRDDTRQLEFATNLLNIFSRADIRMWLFSVWNEFGKGQFISWRQARARHIIYRNLFSLDFGSCSCFYYVEVHTAKSTDGYTVRILMPRIREGHDIKFIIVHQIIHIVHFIIHWSNIECSKPGRLSIYDGMAWNLNPNAVWWLWLLVCI